MSYVPMPPEGNQGDDEEVQEPSQEDQPIAEEQLAPADSPVAKLPPEAQGEVNGGPLGCCLGVMVGLLFSLAVAVLSRLYADQLALVFHSNLSLITRIVMAVLAVVGAIVCGDYGWKIGRRFYREY